MIIITTIIILLLIKIITTIIKIINQLYRSDESLLCWEFRTFSCLKLNKFITSLLCKHFLYILTDIHLFGKFNFEYSENNGRRSSDSKRKQVWNWKHCKTKHLYEKCCCWENAEVIERLFNPTKVEETRRGFSKISKIFAPLWQNTKRKTKWLQKKWVRWKVTGRHSWIN